MNKRNTNRVKVVRKGSHPVEVGNHFPKSSLREPLTNKRKAEQLALQRLADLLAEKELREELRRGSAEIRSGTVNVMAGKVARIKTVKQSRQDLPRRLTDPEYAAWYLMQVMALGDIAALKVAVEDFVAASGIYEDLGFPGSPGEERRIRLMQRLATLINPEKLRRKHGESISRALVRIVKDQTDEQLERMVYEMESGEPG